MMIQEKFQVGRYINLLPGMPPDPQGAAAAGFQRLNPISQHIQRSERSGWRGLVGPKTSVIAAGHIQNAKRDFDWLEYVPGVVSEVPQLNMSVLTGPMSGCWVTSYTRNNVRYVGHVGTVNSAADPQSIAVKAAWNTFAAQPGTIIHGFNPAREWIGDPPQRHIGEGNFMIFGLVTANGLFFSIFAYAAPHVNGQRKYRIAGTRQVASAPLADLQNL